MDDDEGRGGTNCGAASVVGTIGAVGISATNGIAGADVSFTMEGIEDDVTIGEGGAVWWVQLQRSVQSARRATQQVQP